jgi:hypothetical protein
MPGMDLEEGNLEWVRSQSRETFGLGHGKKFSEEVEETNRASKARQMS